MPRLVLKTEHLKIDPSVQMTIKSGVVKVTGPRGTLETDFGHLKLDFDFDAENHQVNARCWFGNRKLLARIGTLFGHIRAMVTGVTKGYRYHMKFVYSHFPIKHVISDAKDEFSFTHFMGFRERKGMKLPKGTTVYDTPGAKEEITVEGINLQDVTQACARIHQFTRIQDKDLRKFLDGIYVSEKAHIQE